jgi:hypothetical protein
MWYPTEDEHGALRSLTSRVIKAGLAGPLGIRNARLVGAFRAFRTSLRAGFDLANGPHVSVDVALSWAATRVGSVPVGRNHGSRDAPVTPPVACPATPPT